MLLSYLHQTFLLNCSNFVVKFWYIMEKREQKQKDENKKKWRRRLWSKLSVKSLPHKLKVMSLNPSFIQSPCLIKKSGNCTLVILCWGDRVRRIQPIYLIIYRSMRVPLSIKYGFFWRNDTLDCPLVFTCSCTNVYIYLHTHTCTSH